MTYCTVSKFYGQCLVSVRILLQEKMAGSAYDAYWVLHYAQVKLHKVTPLQEIFFEFKIFSC